MLFTSKHRWSDNRQRRLKSARPQLELLENRLQPSAALLGQELELLSSSLAPLDPAWLQPANEHVIVQSPPAPEHSTTSTTTPAAVPLTNGGTTSLGAVAPPAMPIQPPQSYSQNAAPMGGKAPLALGAAAGNVTPTTLPASATALRRAPGVHQLTELQVGIPLLNPQLQLAPAAIHSVPQQVHGDASQNWATYVTQTTTAATAQAVTVDNNGYVYVTGATDEGTAKKAFVAEYDPNGNQIFFTTFQAADVLSNPGHPVNYSHSQGNAIALDGNGNIYVVGTATEMNAPHYEDAFIMRFDSSGNVDPTYGAGYNSPAGNVEGNGVAVASDGTATLVGSARLPASDGSGTIHQDVFLAQLSADGSVPSIEGIPYYFGFGPGGFSYQGAQQFGGTVGNGIALSPDGTTAYVSGTGSPTSGTNTQALILAFSVSSPFSLSGLQLVLNGTGAVVPSNDGPVVGNGIAVGSDGSVYQAGTTSYQENGQTSQYPFAINWMPNLSPSQPGQAPVNFSGLDDSQPNGTGTGIAVDPLGNIYLTGTGFDSNGIQRALVDYAQGSGGQLQISDFTLIAQNGSGVEGGWGIAYSNNSNTAFVAGYTTSSNLSTDTTALNGSQDAFLANVGSFMN